MINSINIALLGLGTVGSGVKKILHDNKELIEKRMLVKTDKHININIKKILVKNLSKHMDIDKSIITDDFNDIINDSSIDIIVELIGGKDIATEYILESLMRKKHVVSANKMAIAYNGDKINLCAKENNVSFMYEASVAGTIPVIRVIEDSLTANNIYKISGIINGTTNYILTKMTKEGLSFDEALLQAQDLGFAEADPSSDLDGFDAMYKIAILSRLAYNVNINLDEIEISTLRTVTADDVKNATIKNHVIKYVAESEFANGKLSLKVGPKEIPMSDPLAFVDNATNAVYLYCDKAGRILLEGQGAGSEPTASAVIGDILNIIERRF
jgi:homoserine dehydrogenase